ncbi:MAG: serine/threonine dehydratase [Opitutus sp.]|nr:serine/threonine dehydratase [Opitutus sp.]
MSASISFRSLDSAAAEQRVRPHVRETRVIPAPWLGGQVWLKLENEQETGSFKLRGAANRLLTLSPEEAQRGVVTASNGNHALAVATMGRKLGVPVEVYVSNTATAAKRATIAACGATVNQSAGDCLAAEIAALSAGAASGRVYVSPYNDLLVAEGQGTIAIELLRQLPRLDAVLVAVGGGGLIGGIGAALKQRAPHVQVVGCWPENSPALHACLRAGKIIDVPEQPTLSTSTAGGVEPDAVTFPLAQHVIGRAVLVSETEILAALQLTYRETGMVIEGAAGVALAAYQKHAPEFAGQAVAIIVCGGNVDAAVAAQITASA